MPDLAHLLQQGSTNLWIFVPSAILLGALHGLEPGHSKTMMAAFIVAIRGTVAQAILLGLSATASHTAIVWAIALGGLYFGRNLNLETSEPYFQLASAAVILCVAAWMVWRTWREQRTESRHAHEHHDYDHDHHDHDDHGHDHDHHDDHDHDHHHHDDDLKLAGAGFQDAHERAHADDIRRRFATRNVTTGQIIVFGLTGGLIPCPASITVLLLCLQLKQVALGAALVLCFSIGLAATMVSVGVVAALGMRHAERRWAGLFAKLAQRAPYASAALIVVVGVALAVPAVTTLIR
ncbi:MAG: nickel/cobalt efflux transporter [Caulobacterales bacterium]